MDIKRELWDIGALIRSEKLMAAVRQEVKGVFGKKAMVVGGQYAEKHANNASQYDVVIIHKAGDDKKEVELIARRLKASMPDVEVQKLAGLVDNVIGIKQARRVK